METFHFLFFFIFVDAIVAILLLNFFRLFTGCEVKRSQYIVYIVLGYCLGIVNLWVIPDFFMMLMDIILLVGVGYIILKNKLLSSIVSSSIAVLILYLSFGILNAISFGISPFIVQINYDLMKYIGIVSAILSLLLVYVAYKIILKKFTFDGTIPKQHIFIFLLPTFIVFMICEYISFAFYTNTVSITSLGIVYPGVNHWFILLALTISGSLLICTLYSCKKLSEGLSVKMRLSLLEREAHTQKKYWQEAKTRHEQTQAFRHDFKNHLLALDGLLKSNEIDRARAYVDRIENISDVFSFTSHTGNTVVDTLLDGKLGLAQQNGINVECSVKIPQSVIDDTDWCVVFSNSLDNAIKACKAVNDGDKFIRISGMKKGDFFMLEVENSCTIDDKYEKGSGFGLSNIEAVAEEYQGAITVEKHDDLFRLNVLFIISRH